MSLTTLASGFFTDQGSLQKLYLNDNALTCLPSDTFSPLGALTVLEIEGNPDIECGGSITNWGGLLAGPTNPTSWAGSHCASQKAATCPATSCGNSKTRCLSHV